MATAKRVFIVGIGVSAGGIEALEGMFRAMPQDSGMGFVVVAHLPAGRDSALPEVLDRSLPFPVRHAEDGVAVGPDQVYVGPPDAVVTFKEGHLQVTPVAQGQHERNPIDIFLSSLGDDQGALSIAVILSGAGSDGTLGVKAVKERGGLTIAQGTDGTAPRHAGMPSSAIATGFVDLVLSAEGIAEKLVEYVHGFAAVEPLTADEEGEGAPHPGAERLAAVRWEICGILRNQVGHDFVGYKDKTFLRRVQRRMQVLRMISVDAYIERLRQEPDEVSRLFRDLLIGVTDFFRDAEAFAVLEATVIPPLLDGKGADDTIRVWCPGCATGEEIYSIAILLRERLDLLRSAPKLQLFATDIDDAALDLARTARYPAALLQGVSPERLRRHFTAENGSYVVAKQIRDLCIFSSHSLIRDPPFSRIDLISCRNLLIYLNIELQSQIIPLFHYALRPSGFLFLGSSENISQHRDLFTPINKKSRIFQRRDSGLGPTPFPLLPPGRRETGIATGLRGMLTPAGSSLRRTIESHVVERFAPAHVVVNRNGDVVHYSARTGKYLEAAPGQPSRQLLALARKGLRLELRAALQDVMASRRPATREQVAVEVDGRVQVVRLTVEPLGSQDSEPLFVVLFEDVGPLLSPEQAATQARTAVADPSVDQLERELRETRERLQSTIEEYETALEELKSANEELVSVNEELQSTNEELETGKEEIQSVNEELHTVNQELSVKVEQLDQANNDLRNLFESTQIAIVFLDRQMIVRSFTPAVTALFNLIPTDCGRPLADITSQLDEDGLHGDLRQVLASGEALERRMNLRSGRTHYLVRILPYRLGRGGVNGLVVTFVDMTGIIEAEQQQRTMVHELNHRVRNMLTVVNAIASQTLARVASPEEFARSFTGRIEALSRVYGLVAREQWGDVGLRDVIEDELKPYLTGSQEQIALTGPAVLLRPKAAIALGMVLHELAANAIKYGALSAAEGKIEVTWTVGEGDGLGPLRLLWRETGGPSVVEPTRRGFGTELIRLEIEHELQGTIELAFVPEGVSATLNLPAGERLFS